MLGFLDEEQMNSDASQGLPRQRHGTLLPDQTQPPIGRNVAACGRLDLGVSLISGCACLGMGNSPSLRVVELTVGVMCSCMPAFAGFFHYYLPLLRSIGSFLSQRVRSLNLLKVSSKSRPSSSENSRRLATKDIKMTLGTQIDGRGQFLNPTSVFAREEDWLKLGQAAFNPPSLERKPSGTRREWHEGMAELRRQSLSSHAPMTMSGKTSVQTHIRSLPIHDEERGVSVHAVHIGVTGTCPPSQDRGGYF